MTHPIFQWTIQILPCLSPGPVGFGPWIPVGDSLVVMIIFSKSSHRSKMIKQYDEMVSLLARHSLYSHDRIWLILKNSTWKQSLGNISPLRNTNLLRKFFQITFWVRKWVQISELTFGNVVDAELNKRFREFYAEVQGSTHRLVQAPHHTTRS